MEMLISRVSRAAEMALNSIIWNQLEKVISFRFHIKNRKDNLQSIHEEISIDSAIHVLIIIIEPFSCLLPSSNTVDSSVEVYYKSAVKRFQMESLLFSIIFPLPPLKSTLKHYQSYFLFLTHVFPYPYGSLLFSFIFSITFHLSLHSLITILDTWVNWWSDVESKKNEKVSEWVT